MSSLFVATRLRTQIGSVLLPSLAPLHAPLLVALQRSILARWGEEGSADALQGGGGRLQERLSRVARHQFLLHLLTRKHEHCQRRCRHLSEQRKQSEAGEHEQLVAEIKQLRAQLKAYKQDICELEEDLLPQYAWLPNLLHAECSPRGRIVAESVGGSEEHTELSPDSPDDRLASLRNSDVGGDLGGLDMDFDDSLGVLTSSEGTVFLHGRLASAELALQQCVADWMSSPHESPPLSSCTPTDQQGEWAVRVTCPDTVKSFVLEACVGHRLAASHWQQFYTTATPSEGGSGNHAEFGDSEEVRGVFPATDELSALRLLLHHSETESRTCLVGGASLPALAATLARSSLHSDTLPDRLYTLGRVYHNLVDTDGAALWWERGGVLERWAAFLAGTRQTTTARCLSLSADTPNTSSSCSGQFDGQLHRLQQFYCRLLGSCARWRWCSVSPRHLLPSQSRRVELHLFLPALQRYVCVAYVAQLDDYVARRLQIVHAHRHVQSAMQPVFMVDTCVMHVQRVLAAFLTRGTDGVVRLRDLPSCVSQYM